MLYLADMEGLYMLDISDPKNPSQNGLLALSLYQQDAPGQRNMVIQNGKIFLANGNQGMLVVDGSDQPTLTGRFDVPLPGADLDVLVELDLRFIVDLARALRRRHNRLVHVLGFAEEKLKVNRFDWHNGLPK